MKAGFYETDITPMIGMERPATYIKTYLETIHDRLKVRAAVFSDKKEAVAMVGIDSCIPPSAPQIKLIRKEIEKRTGIKSGGIMIAASHTHAGGPLFGFREEEYADAPELIKELISKYSVCPNYLYHDYVKGQIVTAVCEAYRRRQEASISCGSGFEDQVAFNRRFKMKNGRAYTHPGKGNPDIVEPAGPIDPAVGVLAAWDKKDKLLGCAVNYACHGTTNSGKAVTADWIYYMEQRICGAMNRDATVVFLPGASGDITQINNLSLSELEIGEKSSDFVGSRIGAEAIKVMVSAEKGDFSPVAHRQKVIKIKRRKPSKERIKESLEIVKDGLKKSNFDTKWMFAKELLVADYMVNKQPEVPVEIQGIQVGAAVFLANPSELFCQLGLNIKKSSPFPLTFVVELANGAEAGYVPGKNAFLPSGGGYETVLTGLTNLEISAGEKIVKASVEIAKSFKPGKVPQRPQIKKPIPQWSFGVLGPDLE